MTDPAGRTSVVSADPQDRDVRSRNTTLILDGSIPEDPIQPCYVPALGTEGLPSPSKGNAVKLGTVIDVRDRPTGATAASCGERRPRHGLPGFEIVAFPQQMGAIGLRGVEIDGHGDAGSGQLAQVQRCAGHNLPTPGCANQLPQSGVAVARISARGGIDFTVGSASPLPADKQDLISPRGQV